MSIRPKNQLSLNAMKRSSYSLFSQNGKLNCFYFVNHLIFYIYARISARTLRRVGTSAMARKEAIFQDGIGANMALHNKREDHDQRNHREANQPAGAAALGFAIHAIASVDTALGERQLRPCVY
jgi:hypothetical protein